MDMDEIPFLGDDVYLCASMRVVEVGLIAGEKLRRQVRAANVTGNSDQRSLVWIWGLGDSSKWFMMNWCGCSI